MGVVMSSLLHFSVLGIYVNRDGLRSRKQELLWHSTPMSFGKDHIQLIDIIQGYMVLYINLCKEF